MKVEEGGGRKEGGLSRGQKMGQVNLWETRPRGSANLSCTFGLLVLGMSAIYSPSAQSVMECQKLRELLCCDRST